MNGCPEYPGLDAHAEDHLRARLGGEGGRLRRLGAGIERDAYREAVRARGVGTPRGIVRSLDVKRDRVAAGRRDLGEVVGRVVTMRWQSSIPPASWIMRRDRAEHDRPDRHRGNEVAVTDVEVEDAAAGVEQCPDLRRRGT